MQRSHNSQQKIISNTRYFSQKMIYKISLQNSTLHQELEQLKQENMELRARLSKYQDV